MHAGIQFVALALSGLLAGNELGTLIGAHPALRALPPKSEIAAEQALTGHLAKIMPVYTSVTLAAVVAAGIDRRGTEELRLTAAAASALVAMLAVTGLGNVPLNKRTMSYLVDGEVDGWQEIRRRWDRLHTARVVLDVGAFACLAKAALTSGQEPSVPG